MSAIVNRSVRPDHISLFVNGCGGSQETAKEQALVLSSYVYDHSLRNPSRIQSAFNDAKNPGDISTKGAKVILGYLTSDKMRTDSGGIQLVIFSHSNGAKLVRHALEHGTLKSALIEKAVEEDQINEVMNIIRKQAAVITFGGVSFVPKSFAQIVYNFRFDDDYMSRASHYAGFGNHGDSDAYYRLPSDPGKERSMKNEGPCGSFVTIPAASQILDHMSFMSSSSASSVSNTGTNAHYLPEYLKVEAMISFIDNSLGLRASR